MAEAAERTAPDARLLVEAVASLPWLAPSAGSLAAWCRAPALLRERRRGGPDAEVFGVPPREGVGVLGLEEEAADPGHSLHGTSLPQLLGQAVSHGCVRVANTTARKLKALAPLGTPIWIKK